MHYARRRWRLGRRRHQWPIRITIRDALAHPTTWFGKQLPNVVLNLPSDRRGREANPSVYIIILYRRLKIPDKVSSAYRMYIYPTLLRNNGPEAMQWSYFRCTHICCHQRHPVSPLITPRSTTAASCGTHTDVSFEFLPCGKFHNRIIRKTHIIIAQRTLYRCRYYSIMVYSTKLECQFGHFNTRLSK